MGHPNRTEDREAGLRPGLKGCYGPLLLWAYLLSPLLVRMALSTDARFRFGELIAFHIGLSLLWAAVLHFSGFRHRRLHLWLLPFYLTTAADLFVLTVFNSRLTSGYIAIALTDYSEFKEFFGTYREWIGLHVLIMLIVFLMGRALTPVNSASPRRGLVQVAGAALFMVYAGMGWNALAHGGGAVKAALDVAGKDHSAPLGVMAQTLVAGVVQFAGGQARQERLTYRTEAQAVDPSTSPAVVVWVIGESSRPQNWSLFGYGRDTTPLVRQWRGLVPLTNLQTTAVETDRAVPSMLSLQPITDWRAILSQRSIVSSFRDAGYETHWLSMQSADSWAGVIPALAQEAEHRRYFEMGFDSELLPHLQTVLNDRQADKKLFIVLHTKGSHFEYKRRYPGTFAKFLPTVDARKERLIAEYDNSVLFTDFILDQIKQCVEKLAVPAILVYASDHGENLLDDKRQLLGHAQGTEFDLHTAALLWFSPEYQQLRPRNFDRAKQRAGASLTLSNLPHTVLQAAGVVSKGLNPRRSIVDAQFMEQERHYRVRGELHLAGRPVAEPLTSTQP